jgi:UDP-N-acetylglucosamine acyltransferase
MTHPTAVIHAHAQVHPTVVVGPYAVIDEHVVLGAHCVLGPHVYLTGHTTIGEHNRFHAGCVMGDAPQDLKYAGAPTRLRIGHHNIFREHVTVHRSNQLTEDTVIGSECFLMAHVHVAHNCQIEDRAILAGGAMLAGHVAVGERAFVSGNCVVHQFVRIGALSMMQGGAAVSKDVPPFTLADRNQTNILCGLNSVGLRRAGITAAERLELKKLYRLLLTGTERWREALEAARAQFRSGPAIQFIEFVASSKRGICRHRGSNAEEDPRE